MSFLILVSHVSAAFNCSDMLDRLILIERWIQTAQQVMRARRSNHCQAWFCSLHSDLMNMLVCNTICIIAAYFPVCPVAWENHLKVYIIYNVYIYIFKCTELKHKYACLYISILIYTCGNNVGVEFKRM